MMALLKDAATDVCGLSGREIELQVTAALPPDSLAPKETTLRTHHVAVAKGDQLYEFVYSADAGNYPRYHAAFDRLLQTLHCSP